MLNEDLQRIQFVTRRFHDLQGLYAVAVGAALIAGSTLASYMSRIPEPFDSRPLTAWSWASILFMPAAMRIAQLYRVSYGRASTGRSISIMWRSPVSGEMRSVDRQRQGWKELQVVQLAMLCGYGVDLGRIVTGRTGVSAVPLALALAASWVVVRDGAWRRHHLLAVMLGLAGAFVSQPAGAGVARPGADYLLAYALTGLGLVLTGFGDHHLLTRAMRPTGSTAASAGQRGWLGGARLQLGLITVFGGGCVWAMVSEDGALSLVMMLLMAMVVCANFWIMQWRQMHERPLVPAPPAPTRFVAADAVMPIVLATAAVADHWQRTRGGLSLVALAFAMSGAWVMRRDWPHRRYHLASVIAGLAAAVLHLGVHTSSDAVRWLAAALTMAGIAMTIEGALDARMYHREPRQQQMEAADAHTV